jgi:hypothetical protein
MRPGYEKGWLYMIKTNTVLGVILIVMGILLGLTLMDVLPAGMGMLYIFAIGFLTVYFMYSRSMGVLMPGCIFAAVAAFITVFVLFDNVNMFLILIFIGLAFVAVFFIHTMHLNTRNRSRRFWPLLPGLTLTGAGALLVVVDANIITVNLRYINLIAPGILIAAGIVIIIINLKRKPDTL